jgi:hypothetical protein
LAEIADVSLVPQRVRRREGVGAERDVAVCGTVVDADPVGVDAGALSTKLEIKFCSMRLGASGRKWMSGRASGTESVPVTAWPVTMARALMKTVTPLVLLARWFEVTRHTESTTSTATYLALLT